MADRVGAAVQAAASTATQNEDVSFLQQRLRMVTEWHERAEAKLQQLLACPNETRQLRAKISDPDIALPLLQSYDASMADMAEELRKARADAAEAQGELARRADIGLDAGTAARVAEERAEMLIAENAQRLLNYEHEVAVLKQELTEARRDVAAAREEHANFVVSDSGQKDSSVRLQHMVQQQAKQLEDAKGQLGEAREAAATAERQLRQLQSAAEEDRSQGETQRVQLQLAARETEDKSQELERLRAKMVGALKQAADNHTTHLRLVEERHRAAMEGLREECRAHELAAAKTKAQLARADMTSGPASQLLTMTPAAVLDHQARHAQELELKRLYGELSQAQLQRDDMKLRLEQLGALRRTEVDEKARALKRDLDTAQLKGRELEERLARAEADAERLRAQLSAAKEQLRGVTADRARLDRELAAGAAKLDQARRDLALREQELDAARTAAAEQDAQQDRALRAAERRVEEQRREALAARDRHAAEVEDLTSLGGTLRAHVAEWEGKAAAAQATVHDRDRELETARSAVERLGQGLQQHKQQLLGLDQRLLEAQQREEHSAAEARQAALAAEQLRLELCRSQRDRDTAVAEAGLMRQQLQRLQQRRT